MPRKFAGALREKKKREKGSRALRQSNHQLYQEFKLDVQIIKIKLTSGPR